MQENKMGVRPVGRLLAEMAIPMMISMLVQAFYNVVDSIFVAKLSEEAFNAVSLAFPLQNLMIAFGTGTGVGVNALLSRALGAKDRDQVDRTANVGVVLFILTYAAFALIGVFGSAPFFRAQTDAADIVRYGTDYSRICLGLSFGLFSQFLFERLLQSTGRTKLSMLTQLLGAIVNIILDPILIFGLCGLPRMEVAGAALATVIGQILSAILGLYLNLHHNPEIHLSFAQMRWRTRTVGEIYEIGFPSIVMSAISSVMTFGMNQILLGFSTTATAVFGAYFKLQSFIFMPVFGLNNALVPILAYNYGARRPDRMHKAIRTAIVYAVSLMLLGFALMQLIPGVFLRLFDASDDMLAIGIPALRTVSIAFLAAGFCIVLSAAFQALGKGTYSMFVSIARQLVVLVPVAWLLSKTGNLNAVWWSYPIAEVMSVFVTLFLFSHLRNKVIRPLDEEFAKTHKAA